MSRYFSSKYASLVPYTPGEQPRDRKFIKLNTNENPFPPAPAAVRRAAEAAAGTHLYSDPTCKALVDTACEYFGVNEDEILFTNGSDEILNFAFMAFCDEEHPALFPDITYGFYSVFAELNHVPYRELPLKDDFTVDTGDYLQAGGTIFLANPNAPTGIVLSLDRIEEILQANPNTVVVIDEAYVDFCGETAVGLIHKYDNLLVTQTFSKSRSLAGGRLGFGIGCADLIRDLNTIKYSTNPYNVNSMTMAAGIGAFEDRAYFEQNCTRIMNTRTRITAALREMGFTIPDSGANFIFAAAPGVGGMEMYSALREKGILVRHFETPRLKDYNRITIGSDDQMDALLAAVREILEERA